MQHVGQILRNTRLSRNLSLEDIERQTRIRKKLLLYIENSQWLNFSSSTYIIGIIQRYAQCVGLNPNTMTAFFRREYETNISVRFKTRLEPHRLFPLKRKLALLLSISMIFLFSIYLSYQLFLFVKTPSFSVIEPVKSTIITRSQTIRFVLTAEKESMVTINNRRIFPNEKMIFSTNVPFIDDVATVKVEIIGANGKKNNKIFTYIRQKP